MVKRLTGIDSVTGLPQTAETCQFRYLTLTDKQAGGQILRSVKWRNTG